jgi:hypothetical protein
MIAVGPRRLKIARAKISHQGVSLINDLRMKVDGKALAEQLVIPTQYE